MSRRAAWEVLSIDSRSIDWRKDFRIAVPRTAAKQLSEEIEKENYSFSFFFLCTRVVKIIVSYISVSLRHNITTPHPYEASNHGPSDKLKLVSDNRRGLCHRDHDFQFHFHSRGVGEETNLSASQNVLWVIIIMIVDCTHKPAICPGNGVSRSTAVGVGKTRFLRSIVVADWPEFRWSKKSEFQGSAEAWTRRTWLFRPRSLSSAFRGPCRARNR